MTVRTLTRTIRQAAAAVTTGLATLSVTAAAPAAARPPGADPTVRGEPSGPRR